MNGLAAVGPRVLGFQAVAVRRVPRVAGPTLSVLVAVAGLGLLLAAVLTWCRVEWVRLSYRASAASAQARTLEAEHRTLVLELATLRSPAVLSDRAAHEAGLAVPGPDRVWVVGGNRD